MALLFVIAIAVTKVINTSTKSFATRPTPQAKAAAHFEKLCPLEVSVPASFEGSVLGWKDVVYQGRVDPVQERIFVYALTDNDNAMNLGYAAAASATGLANGDDLSAQVVGSDKDIVIYAPKYEEVWDCASTFGAVSPTIKKKKNYPFKPSDADAEYVDVCIRNDPSVCPGELNHYPNLDTESMRKQLLRLGVTKLYRKKNPFSSTTDVANAPRNMLLSALLWHSHLVLAGKEELQKFGRQSYLGESFANIYKRHVSKTKKKKYPNFEDVPLVVSYLNHHKEISTTELDLGKCEKKIRVPLAAVKIPVHGGSAKQLVYIGTWNNCLLLAINTLTTTE